MDGWMAGWMVAADEWAPTLKTECKAYKLTFGNCTMSVHQTASDRLCPQHGLRRSCLSREPLARCAMQLLDRARAVQPSDSFPSSAWTWR